MRLIRAWFCKMATFDGWMAVSEIIDALRVFPRIVLLYVLWGDFAIINRVLQFYFDASPADKAQTTVATLCGSVITAVAGFLPLIVMMYNNSSRDWSAYHNEKKGRTSSAHKETLVASSTTTTTGPKVGG